MSKKRISTVFYQAKSALEEICLIEQEKRDWEYKQVIGIEVVNTSKKDFKEIKKAEGYIFSIRTMKNTLEKVNTFLKWIKDKHRIKYLRDITSEHCKEYFQSNMVENKASTLKAYKNALMKLSYASEKKFNNTQFYTDEVRNFKCKFSNGVRTTSISYNKRFYSLEQMNLILNCCKGKYEMPIKVMAYGGLRISELYNLRPEHITLESNETVYTVKDGLINKAFTIYVKGKGGKESYRPIIDNIEFFRELKNNGQEGQRILKQIPKDSKKARSYVGKALARTAKRLGLPVCYKNHEFRKYFAKTAYDKLINDGWSRKNAAEFIVNRCLSHGRDRSDLKKIYIFS
jgi:integrase